MSLNEHGFTRDEDIERKKKAAEAEKMIVRFLVLTRVQFT
jgi:hypothetical protein